MSEQKRGAVAGPLTLLSEKLPGFLGWNVIESFTQLALPHPSSVISHGTTSKKPFLISLSKAILLMFFMKPKVSYVS